MGDKSLLQMEDCGFTDVENQLTALQPGKRYKVDLRCLKHYGERFARGQMTIRTNDPSAPERSVRIFAQFGSQAAAPLGGRGKSGTQGNLRGGNIPGKGKLPSVDGPPKKSTSKDSKLTGGDK